MNIYYEQFSHLESNLHFLNRYLKLISIFKERNLSKAKNLENHHIFPKSFGGSNKKENLVYLHPKEHYILHHLLWKAFPGNKSMMYAFRMMCNFNKEKISAKIFEQLRNEFSLRHSIDRKGKPTYNKGIPHSEEHKQNISDANKGRIHSDVTKKKISDANKGKLINFKRSDVTKQKIGNAARGRKHTEETKQRLSEINTGRKHTEETKQKLSEINKGKTRSPETIQKIKETKRKNRLAKLSIINLNNINEPDTCNVSVTLK